MKILWVCGSRIIGGAERVTLQLAGLFRARGHEVEALCRLHSDLEPALTSARIPIHRARLGGSLNFPAVPAIRRALTVIGPDVALVTTSDEWVWSCLARRRESPPRLVLVRHMAMPLARRVCWLAGQRADAVVAVSGAVRQSLLGAGIPQARVHLIYNPVRFTPRPAVPGPDDRARARSAMGLTAAGHWVGFFGGLNPAKGLRDVLSAVRCANQEVGATNLLICGPAGADQLLAGWTRELHLEGRVCFLGPVERVEEALTAADVVVMATHRQLSEALPATLIEALACGTPVLAYATGGIPEIIGHDGRAGRLAKPDDADDLARALAAMLRDQASAERMAAAGLARVRIVFDPQRIADQYEQLFLNLSAG